MKTKNYGSVSSSLAYSSLAIALFVGSLIVSSQVMADDQDSDAVDTLVSPALSESGADQIGTSDELEMGMGRGGPGRGRPGGPGGFHPGPRPGPVHGPERIFNPAPIHGGVRPWQHWNHPVFARPAYFFNWGALRLVTCTAQDAYGDQFPVTEDGYYGAVYQSRIQEIEDAALDRCYQESNGDAACFLVGCTPGY